LQEGARAAPSNEVYRNSFVATATSDNGDPAACYIEIFMNSCAPVQLPRSAVQDGLWPEISTSHASFSKEPND
jgi:hypothetical protein